MRKLITALILVLLTANLNFAQNKSNSLKNAERNYLSGLNHKNPGVVESTIINTMILKLYHPEKNFSDIIEKLEEISLENPQKIIRVKAFIASNYLKHPDRFNWIEKKDYDQALQFFQLYSERIQQQLDKTKTAVTMN